MSRTENKQAFSWQRLCLVRLNGDDMFIQFKVKPSWTPPPIRLYEGRCFVFSGKYTEGAPATYKYGAPPSPDNDVRLDTIDLKPYPIYKEAS
jgi:hypothetical protein